MVVEFKGGGIEWVLIPSYYFLDLEGALVTPLDIMNHLLLPQHDQRNIWKQLRHFVQNKIPVSLSFVLWNSVVWFHSMGRALLITELSYVGKNHGRTWSSQQQQQQYREKSPSLLTAWKSPVWAKKKRFKERPSRGGRKVFCMAPQNASTREKLARSGGSCSVSKTRIKLTPPNYS